MSLGIVSRSFHRGAPHAGTVIDGLPVTFNPGTPLYVDGGLAASGDGLTYDSAKSTIQAAVTAAAAYATIFIKPKLISVAASSKYNENIIVPITTHPGLSFIGAIRGFGTASDQGVSIRGASGVDSPALLLLSAHAHVENVHFRSRSAQTTGGLVQAPYNTNGGDNIGSSFIHCSFSQDLGSAAGAGVAQHTLRLDSTQGALVEDCLFQDCRIGISILSSAAAAQGITLRNNAFRGIASNIAVDILAADVTGLQITDNHFLHALPSYGVVGGATYNKYFLRNGASCTGGISGNSFATDTATEATNLTIGEMIMGVNYVAGAFMAV
jgi:hypothetical protein